MASYECEIVVVRSFDRSKIENRGLRIASLALSILYPLSSILGLAFCALSCTTQSDKGPVLARVGERVVTSAEYAQRLKDVLMLTPLDDARMRQAVLETMIDEQALLIEADRRGLRETDDFKHYAKSLAVDALLEAYREVIADRRTVVQESDVQAAFVLANEQAAARHLYTPTLEQATALYEKLQAGASFEELAPQVFKDYRLARNGGYLGYFKWDDMDPTFAAAAQSLKKGEISKPVRTKFGYSIIKLEDRVRAPLLTETQYGVQRKKLRWVVEHRKRAAEIQKLDAETRDRLNIEFDEAMLARLFQEIMKSRPDTTWRAEAANGQSMLDPQARIATVAGKKWTLQDFRERAVLTSPRQRNKVQRVEDLRDFIVGLALRDEYVRRAKRENLEKNPRVLRIIQTKQERFLLNKMQSLLTAPITVPIDSSRALYEARPQDYVHPARLRLREITVANREQAEYIVRRLRAGEDFALMARQYSMRKWTAERGGEVGEVTAGDLGRLGEEIFKLKAGEIGGPYEHENSFLIVQVIEHTPARDKTFDEARNEIEATLLPTFTQRAFEEQVRELRKPLTIEVNQSVFQEVKSPL